MRETFLNLLTLVEHGIITNNTVVLYLYYRLHKGKATPMKTLKKKLNISGTAIALHNTILRYLKLVKLESAGVGKPNIPIKIRELTETRVNFILHSSIILYNIASLKESKYYRFSPRGFKIEGKNYINNNKKEELTVLDTGNNHLKSVLSVLPKKYHSFSVAPHFLSKLEQLAEEYDIREYTRWFVNNKLNKTVNGFNLGIFLYSGILDEYKTTFVKKALLNKRKKTKNTNRFSAKKIKEEFLSE